MTRIIRLVFFMAAVVLVSAVYTGAYFTDSVTLSGERLSIGKWDNIVVTPICGPGGCSENDPPHKYRLGPKHPSDRRSVLQPFKFQ